MVSTKNFENRPQIGKRLSLDFINTEGEERNGPPDWLESYSDIVRWVAAEGLLTADQTADLLTEASEKPRAADDVFDRAITLRESLFRILRSLRQGKEPVGGDLAIVSRDGESQVHTERRPLRVALWRWGARARPSALADRP
jgi:hypothetical protein